MNSKINLKFNDYSLEIEGEEKFVEKVYFDFKELITEKKTVKSLEKKTNPENEKKEPLKTEKKNKQKKLPPKIIIEEFNTDGDKSKKVESLKDFINKVDLTKLQKRANEFILCIAYYLNKKLQFEEFSEGNIEFAYKYLEQKDRPVHLRQVITNIKNSDRWVEPSTLDKKKWTIGRLGESYFENNLIKKL